MEEIINKGQSQLSRKLSVSIDDLQFVGMQSLTSPDYIYVPLFNIVDEKSRFYMSTRAAHIFFKRDKTTNTYIQLSSWAEAEKKWAEMVKN